MAAADRTAPRLLAVVVAATLAGALTFGAAPRPVLAQTSATDRALAETLFQEARRLIADKRYAEACPKLAESQRLDPATGTLLNLAVCHTEEGKLATAWVELNDAVASARHDGRPDREAYARERLAAIQPRLSHMTIIVPEEARIPGLQVKLDGSVVGAGAWGLAAPVDPGPHQVTASAPGHRAWSSRLSIGAIADDKAVRIPVLVAAESAPVAATPAPTETPASAAAETPKPATVTATSPGSSSPLRTAAYVVGGAGIVALGVGGYFGWTAISKWSDRNDHCMSGDAGCDATAVDDYKSAHDAATVANVTIGVGLAAVVTAAILWYRSRPAEGAPATASAATGITSLSFAPPTSDRPGSIVLGGRF